MVFLSAQYTTSDVTPFYRGSGAPAAQLEGVDDTKHRYMGKLTFQLNASNSLGAMVFYDDRFVENRGAGGLLLSSAARKQESPNWEYSTSWDSLINSKNFLSLKLTGFSGRDDRLPYGGSGKAGRNDDTTGFGWDNAAFTLTQKVERATLDATWALSADGLIAGSDAHTFKFGANYELGHYDQDQTRNGGFSYYDRSSRCPGGTADARTQAYFANPSCAAYSSDWGNEIILDAVQSGINLFAQDSMRWRRVTLNYGVRYTRYDAGFKGGDENVYQVDFFSPRLGLVWDVFGNAKTALKGHYGRYYLGMFAYLYDREASGGVYTPYEIRDYNPATGAYDRLIQRTVTQAQLDSGTGHPFTDQFLVSLEQKLGTDLSLGLDLTRRQDDNVVAMVNSNEDYGSASVPGNPLSGGTQLVYNLRSDPVFVIKDAAGAYRRYHSAILRFEKRYSHGWMARASLVWASLKGNALKNNSYVPEYSDRNGQVNADGKLGSFSPWEGKLYASVDLPLGVKASVNYTYLAGEYWTPYATVSGLDKNNRTIVNLLERGSRQLDDRHTVDLRLSTRFKLGSSASLSLFADCFNLLNSDAVAALDQRWGTLNYKASDPSQSTWSSRTAFGASTALVSPRLVRLGARLSF